MKRKPQPTLSMRVATWCLVTATGIILASLFLAFSYSICYGRDRGQYTNVDPAIKSWVEGLKNDRGEGCCATADGYPAEVEWDTEKSSYRVRIEGEWYVIPNEAVIKEPNRLGYAVVWYWPENIEGKMVPHIRCFLPGSGT